MMEEVGEARSGGAGRQDAQLEYEGIWILLRFSRIKL